jgi:transcriptional regulator with XRE-family HTH domain
MVEFLLPGALRRIRRSADLSQRQLADALAVSQSAIAQAETGRRDLPVGMLVRAAGLAGLRLALLDVDGCEVAGMAEGTARDSGGNRFPAHLDTVHTDERPGRYQDQHQRTRPWYTVDRDRDARDELRRRTGTPEDHLVAEPGTAPWEQAARRRREALGRAADERRRASLAGEGRPGPDLECTCPADCDATREALAEVHVADCPCRCDVA